MKQKFFVLGVIALIAIVGLFVFEHATTAQRPDRDSQQGQGQRGNRGGGERGNRGMQGMFNPVSMVDNSWLDLTFKVKVDDETLVKARPIYQETREKFEMKMKEIRESNDMRAAWQGLQSFIGTAGTEFQTSLKKVLSKEQMSELNKLTKERQMQEQQRRSRFGGGDGGQRGGQRGQRPSQ